MESALYDKKQKTFKNTFAPHCPDKELTAGQVIGLLRFSALQNDALPDEVRRAVREELGRRRAETGHN